MYIFIIIYKIVMYVSYCNFLHCLPHNTLVILRKALLSLLKFLIWYYTKRNSVWFLYFIPILKNQAMRSSQKAMFWWLMRLSASSLKGTRGNCYKKILVPVHYEPNFSFPLSKAKIHISTQASIYKYRCSCNTTPHT